MNWLATFSGSRYHDTTRRIVEDAPRFGADRMLVYDDVWLRECRPDFCRRVAYLFDARHGGEPRPRGVCWFAWKALVIWDAFRRIATGDTLLYLDADTYPVAPLGPLFERCRADGGVMLFRAEGCPQGHWTRRDVFLVMGTDRPEYWNATQAVARFALFQKGGTFPVDEFLGEWLAYSCNPLCTTFAPGVIAPALGLPELPGFTEHRCEQSVLGMLAVLYGVRLYREACEFGNDSDADRDVMPTNVFVQHGAHTYGPAGGGEGSSFRNVWD